MGAEPRQGTDVLPVTQPDREAAVEALQRAAGDGRLPLQEFSERVGAALTAETPGQLKAATAGLAAAPPVGSVRMVSSIVTFFGHRWQAGRWRLPGALRPSTFTAERTDEQQMADIKTAPRRPDVALQALDRLAGTWEISGDATGTVEYRWLPGGFFLLQEGELELFGHVNTFTEIIGRHRPFGGEPSTEIHSRVYTSEGDTLDYVYELDGDTLTIWGGQVGSDARYTGTFGADGDTLTGAWAWPGGGYRTISTRKPDAAS